MEERKHRTEMLLLASACHFISLLALNLTQADLTSLLGQLYSSAKGRLWPQLLVEAAWIYLSPLPFWALEFPRLAAQLVPNYR